jgi:hypothetical protein
VGNCHPEADPCAQDAFPFLDGLKHLAIFPSRTLNEMPRELGDNTGLIARCQRNDYPIWCEQFGQEHWTT